MPSCPRHSDRLLSALSHWRSRVGQRVLPAAQRQAVECAGPVARRQQRGLAAQFAGRGIQAAGDDAVGPEFVEGGAKLVAGNAQRRAIGAPWVFRPGPGQQRHGRYAGVHVPRTHPQRRPLHLVKRRVDLLDRPVRLSLDRALNVLLERGDHGPSPLSGQARRQHGRAAIVHADHARAILQHLTRVLAHVDQADAGIGGCQDPPVESRAAGGRQVEDVGSPHAHLVALLPVGLREHADGAVAVIGHHDAVAAAEDVARGLAWQRAHQRAGGDVPDADAVGLFMGQHELPAILRQRQPPHSRVGHFGD